MTARLITYNGRTETEAHWADAIGIAVSTLRKRLKAYGSAAVAHPRHSIMMSRVAPLVDDYTPYSDDYTAQSFVALFQGGATLDDVGDAMGVCRERIRQVEEYAMKKVAIGMLLVDALGADNAIAVLESLRGCNLSDYRQALHDARRL